MSTSKFSNVTLILAAAFVFLTGCETFEDSFGSKDNDRNARLSDICSKTNVTTSECEPYEAEDRTAASGCGVATNHAGFTGSGFMDYGGNGTWIEWNNISAPVAGEFTLTFRYGNGSGGNRQTAVILNGQETASVAFSPTGSWKKWETETLKLSLRQGNNTIRIQANTGSGGPNLDHMLVVGKTLVNDECPDDPDKTEPGECGCDVPEGSCVEAIITASGEFVRAGETKENAFDGNTQTKWLTFTDSAWIQYDFAGDTSMTISGYRITSANDATERDPRDWKLLGSNDGVNYTTLDERTGETFSARFQEKTYIIDNSASYKMYKLDIISNLDPPRANSTQLAEIEFVLDTNDECPDDPDKTEPGECGCGVPDVDSDGDGTPDCNDQCPDDPNKTKPGECGCGVPEGTCDGDGDADGNIIQNKQSFEMPGYIAPTRRWTQRTNGLCGNTCKNGPRQMYTASFEDKLLVSWMAVDESDPWIHFGNVSTFQVSEDGTFTALGDVSFADKCEATLGMTTNRDGSIIGVLCKGYQGSELLPGAIDLLESVRTPNCDEQWEGRCYPIGHYSEIDSPLYLFEYRGGMVTDTPDQIIKINHAVGGWNYGHHEISLNNAEDTYFVHLKVTAGPSETNRHEGLTHFAVRRTPSYEYVRVTDQWGCGPGHVPSNRMAYNRANDTWSQLCTLDWCEIPQLYQDHKCQSITWHTVPGVTEEPQVSYTGVQLLALHNRSTWESTGGGAAILSLGDDGWIALAVGPGYVGQGPETDTIGFMSLPLTVPEFLPTGITESVPTYPVRNGDEIDYQDVTRYQWDWLFLPEPDPSRQENKRAGMANIAYFSTEGEDSARLLVGWSPSIEFQGITSEYVVSEVDREGRLRGDPLVLSSAGWGEDNRWVTMPNSGCVVFPFAWAGDDGPGKSYPHENSGSNATDYPRTLHMTSLCPGTEKRPPLAPSPPAMKDSERWPVPGEIGNHAATGS